MPLSPSQARGPPEQSLLEASEENVVIRASSAHKSAADEGLWKTFSGQECRCLSAAAHATLPALNGFSRFDCKVLTFQLEDGAVV